MTQAQIRQRRESAELTFWHREAGKKQKPGRRRDEMRSIERDLARSLGFIARTADRGR